MRVLEECPPLIDVARQVTPRTARIAYPTDLRAAEQELEHRGVVVRAKQVRARPEQRAGCIRLARAVQSVATHILTREEDNQQSSHSRLK